MKKFVFTLSALLMTGMCISGAEASSILLDGKELSFPVEPVIIEDSVFVPMRSIFEALGAEISWDGETRTVTSEKDGTQIQLTIGAETAYKNGDARTLPAAPVIISDSTMVPVRFVSESFGCAVGWNGETQTVTIKTEPLKGFSAGMIGDSICYGTNFEGGYPNLIASAAGMTVENKGVGGTTITRGSKWDENSDGYRPCILDQVDALSENLDYIIMEGGVNDFWSHVPLGSLTDSGEYDDKTFAGALETLFSKVKNRYPAAKLGFVINHDAFTYNGEGGYAPYYEMIKAACDKWGIPYLDLYAKNNPSVGVNVKDTEQKLLYFASDSRPEGDGVHPNERGYQRIYVEPITAWMATL